MKRRIAALLMVMGFMLATETPAFAQDLGSGACDPNPGNTEASHSPLSTPPQSKPGGVVRNPEANEHDTSGSLNGRGELQEQCA